MAQVVFDGNGTPDTECLIFFGAYLAVEWVYFVAMSIARKRADPALEETRTLAARTAEEAIEILGELPASAVRDALTGFTTTLVRRSR